MSPSTGDSAQLPTRLCVYCGSSPGNNPIYAEAARELAKAMAARNIQLVYGGGTVGLMGELAKTLVSFSGKDSVLGIIPEALVEFERQGDPDYVTESAMQHTPLNGPALERNSHIATNGASNHDDAQPAAAVAAAAVTKSKTLVVPNEEKYGKTIVVENMHQRKQLMAEYVAKAAKGSGFVALVGGLGTAEELLEIATWNQLGLHEKGICLLNINGFWDGILGWIRHAASEGFIKGDNDRIIVEAKTAEEAIQKLRDYIPPESRLKLKWDWGQL